MTIIKKIRVSNMVSPNGNIVANQFRIRTEDGEYFQSYNSIIVYIPSDLDPKIILDKEFWDYSRTTGKYRNLFLGEDKATTEQKIKSGQYLLGNLN